MLGLAVLAGRARASGRHGAARGRRLHHADLFGRARPLTAGHQVIIRYCNDQEARITEPATLHGPAPAAVYVHGGSWVSGDYDTGGFIINRIGPALAAHGFVVVSLDYRLGPHDHWPAQIVDVKCAIRYLRANARRFHIDPNDIGAWGQSAGGHLVALLGTAGPIGRVGHRRLPQRVERRAGGGRHGGAERPAHHGRPGRRRARRRELHLAARRRADTSSSAPT